MSLGSSGGRSGALAARRPSGRRGRASHHNAPTRVLLEAVKHKGVGDTLTDLATDFWKSVRIWLAHYKANGRIGCDARFMLFTTGVVGADSILTMFKDEEVEARAQASRSRKSDFEVDVIFRSYSGSDIWNREMSDVNT